MRQIRDGLYDFLKAHIPHFIQKKRQYDWRREGEDQSIQIDNQGVAKGSGEIKTLKIGLKVLQTDPGRIENILPEGIPDTVILKCDQYTHHREIMKNQII